MTDTINLVMSNWYAEDMGSGDSTTTTSITRRATDGTQVAYTRTYIDSANFPRLSSAAKTLLGLSGTKYLDDAFTALASGSGLNMASTSQQGIIYRMSAAPASANQPIAMEQNDARIGYIPSSAQKSALGVVTSQSVSLTHTASSTNGYVTVNQFRDTNADEFGTGKDGAFATGAITDPAVAPSGLSTSTSGGTMAAATYTYKVTFGNATGETLPSSASSSQATTGSASTITMTIPVGGSNTAWRKIYRDNGSSSWKLVGYIPDNTTTTFTDTLLTPSATTAPGSNTTGATFAPAANAELHFEGDTTLPAFTMGSGGNLTIRCRGTLTISGAITGSSVTVVNPMSGPATGTPVTTNYMVPPPPMGYGANLVFVPAPGVGGAGVAAGGTPGTAGAAGPILRLHAHNIKIKANVTLTGSAGGNASGTNATGGGGGAGGVFFAHARDAITDDGTACTINVSGGNGGNGSGTGAGQNVQGGGGGGGGYIILIAPIQSVASVTKTVTKGSAGTASTTGTTRMDGGGVGGSCAGTGGYYNGVLTAAVAATDGNVITSTGHGAVVFR